MPQYLKDADNALDKFLKVWECFCHFSYKNPEIYYAIFFADLDNDLEDYILEYYEIFPEELEIQVNDISTMLLKHNIYERGMTTINECVKEGFIKKEDAEPLNEIGTLTYEAILFKIIKGKINYDMAIEKTMRYIEHITNSFLIK